MLLLTQVMNNTVHAEIPPLFLETDFTTAGSAEQEILDRNVQLEEDSPYLIRNRYVEIDYKNLKEESTIQLNLFETVQLTAVITRIDERAPDDISFYGKIKNEFVSQFIIVLRQNKVTGSIKYRDKVYHIRWMGGLVHSVAEVDLTVIPQGGPPVEADASNSVQNDVLEQSNGSVAAASTDDGTSIDILVVYTQAAANTGNIKSEIQLAVDDLNQAMINSNVNLSFRLVHTAMLDYKETGIAATDLNRIGRAGDGFMDGVADLRNMYGADLVALITETMNSWAGLGQLNSSTPNESRAFHVTLHYTLLYGTFAHEVGHNLGMHHEKYQDASGGAYSFSHGYVDLTNRFKTIMSYGTQCGALGFSCATINYFSAAPASGVNYSGFAVGDATNADNRQTVINTKLAISQFRQSKSAAELAQIEAVEKGCFIATATYGSFLDPHVQALRDFRDRYLEPYAAGQLIMNFYYQNSPPLARAISNEPILRWFSRLFLTPLVLLVSMPQIFLFLLLVFVSFLIYREIREVGGVS